MVQKLELFPTTYEYSIGKYDNLKEMFVRGDVDISGNIAVSYNINTNGNINFNNGTINFIFDDYDNDNSVSRQNVFLRAGTSRSDPKFEHKIVQEIDGVLDSDTYEIAPLSDIGALGDDANERFRLGGYQKRFKEVQIVAQDGIKVWAEHSTQNTLGNIECNIINCGEILASGSITANSFIGDGSLLTNLPSVIPSLIGNGGKYLTTDGTNLSWASVSSSGGGSVTTGIVGYIYYNGVLENIINNNNLTATRQGTGIYNITFTTPRSNVNYLVFGQIIEPSSTRDDIKIHVEDETQTINGFSVRIYEGDNGGNPDTHQDRKFYLTVIDDITTNSGSGNIANLTDYSDASFGNVDVGGNLEVTGISTFTTNVTVMGNLKVDGLLDMSNNIIMNNNRIIFTASDSSIIPPDTGIIQKVQDISNTLTNVISDVSNLLISNSDASFNNVDISSNLTLKGSLGLLDSSTNNISYGNVGAVLTSNGSGSVPTWTEPVAFKATNDANTNITGGLGIHLISDELTNVSGGNRSAFQVGSSYNTSTGYFTAPYDGLYYFHASVLWDTSAYNQSWTGLYIGLSTLTGGDQALIISQVGGNEAFNADFTQNCDGVAKLNQGQQVGVYVNGNASNWAIERKFCVFGGYLIQRL